MLECKISPPKGKSEQILLNGAWSHTHRDCPGVTAQDMNTDRLEVLSKWMIFATGTHTHTHTHTHTPSVRKAGDLSFSRERLLRMSERVWPVLTVNVQAHTHRALTYSTQPRLACSVTMVTTSLWLHNIYIHCYRSKPQIHKMLCPHSSLTPICKVYCSAIYRNVLL